MPGCYDWMRESIGCCPLIAYDGWFFVVCKTVPHMNLGQGLSRWGTLLLLKWLASQMVENAKGDLASHLSNSMWTA